MRCLDCDLAQAIRQAHGLNLTVRSKLEIFGRPAHWVLKSLRDLKRQPRALGRRVELKIGSSDVEEYGRGRTAN